MVYIKKMTTIKETGKWGKYRLKDNTNVFYYPADVEKILKQAKPRQKLTFQMQLHTGGRINEVRHIKVEDVDFLRNNIILRITKVKSKKNEKRPSPRIIPISSKLAAILRRSIKEDKLKEEDYFPLLSKNVYHSFIKRVTQKLGRKDWMDFSTHNVRKTTETWLVALGIDSLKIVKHLGHTMAVAAKNYVSADIFTRDEKVKMRKILGDLYDYKERF